MSTRSRSRTTHFIAPGDSSDTRVTGTNPSILSRGLGSRALAHLEAEEPRGVLRGDLAQVLLGNSSEDAAQEIPGLRPGRFGMREVASPEHVVDADRVAQLDAEVVLHELHEHVTAPVVARQEPLARLPAPREHRPLPIREIHLLEPVRNPRCLTGSSKWISRIGSGRCSRYVKSICLSQ